MLTKQVGTLVRAARESLGWTQTDLARRADVSTRLVSEFERGRRSNVSLETTLRLLAEVGVVMRLTDARGVSHEIQDPAAARAARAARAAIRRATWGGRQIRIAQEGVPPRAAAHPADRLAEVELVSRQAFAVARASPRGPAQSAQPAERGGTGEVGEPGRATAAVGRSRPAARKSSQARSDRASSSEHR